MAMAMEDLVLIVTATQMVSASEEAVEVRMDLEVDLEVEDVIMVVDLDSEGTNKMDVMVTKEDPVVVVEGKVLTRIAYLLED